MQGLWFWVILRAPQIFWQGYAAKCLPLNGISQVRLKVSLDYGLGVPHVPPPRVERHVHDQIGVVGSQ